MDVIRSNALFPFLLTRALLPQLRKSPGPVEVAFVGSIAADLSLPCFSPYGATKAFLKQLAGALHNDERFRTPSNVSFTYLGVCSVVSKIHRIEPSLLSPTAEAFARRVVARLGCGRRVVYPYIWHAIQAWSTSVSPSWVLNQRVAVTMEEELRASKKI